MTKILLSSGAKPLNANQYAAISLLAGTNIEDSNGETALHSCFVTFSEIIAEIIVKKYSSTIDKLKLKEHAPDTPLVTLLRCNCNRSIVAPLTRTHTAARAHSPLHRQGQRGQDAAHQRPRHLRGHLHQCHQERSCGCGRSAVEGTNQHQLDRLQRLHATTLRGHARY